MSLVALGLARFLARGTRLILRPAMLSIHYSRSPSDHSSHDSTPISTPPHRFASSSQLYTPYSLTDHSSEAAKLDAGASDDFTHDILFPDDEDDCGALDLFPPHLDGGDAPYTMPSPPIAIRSASDSPRSQSILTAQLQQPHINVSQNDHAMDGAPDSGSRQRQESVNMLGARSIPKNNEGRRPSYAPPGSLMGGGAGGMSWGGMSMGSFIRDE